MPCTVDLTAGHDFCKFHLRKARRELRFELIFLSTLGSLIFGLGLTFDVFESNRKQLF